MINCRVKIFRLWLQLVTLAFFSFALNAQSTKEIKEIFAQAESYYLYEEYELANQLYLLLETPDNLNIKYKIGTCYLNITDEKDKAIPYLEAAVKNASYDAKSSSVKETRAPLDAYFYLARAYMINAELEKGLSTFRTFQRLAGESAKNLAIANFDFIDQQVRACNNAIKLTANPVPLTKRLLGRDFSQGSVNENPAISFDGNTIAFTERRGLVNIILYSKKIRGKWQTPVEITTELNAGEDCSTCAMNSDGTELYLYKNDNFDGNIYMSKYEGDRWSPIIRLNRNINTKFFESHASVSSDGSKLYFTSNREGGQGGLDIYVSEKDATGDWGPAENLGTVVNTHYNEDNPFITANDSLLYFCSEGHNSMGGYDNYKSMKLVSGWKTPENLGYPVNSTDDDKFFQPSSNGMFAYYSMKTDYKKREIFYLGLNGADVNNVYEITGVLSLNDTVLSEGRNFKIDLINSTTGDTLQTVAPDLSNGKYTIKTSPGQYNISFSGDGYFSQKSDTSIAQESLDLIITLNALLKRDSSLIEPAVYEKIDLSSIPVVSEIDSSILVRNLNVRDLTDQATPDVLYYTVQVMALYKPVDVSYFRYINDMKVLYNETDKFYRYTTGQFSTREEAAAYRTELIRKGYPEQIFIKTVSK